MYGHQTAPSDFLLFPSSSSTMAAESATTPPFLPPAAAAAHQQLPSAALLQHYHHALSGRILMEAGQHQSSSSTGSSSSPPPQRSLSSHSLQAHELYLAAGGGDQCYVEDSSSCSPVVVRRVFSAGDLHPQGHYSNSNSNRGERESPLSSESSVIIESMNRACKYTPEEKQQRIQRYRTKRNQRNFNKKIKYECRKTLADSRPRIRGRFAKNDEIIDSLHISDDQYHYHQEDHDLHCSNINHDQSSNYNVVIGGGEEHYISYGEEEEDDSSYWVNFLNAAAPPNSFP